MQRLEVSRTMSPRLTDWIRKHPGIHRSYYRWVVCPKMEGVEILVTTIPPSISAKQMHVCANCHTRLYKPNPITGEHGEFEWSPSAA